MQDPQGEYACARIRRFYLPAPRRRRRPRCLSRHSETGRTMQRHVNISVIIGQNIRCIRLEAGLSQKAIGACLGVSFQQVQKYERGRNNITPDSLVKLATLFACRIDQLFEVDAAEVRHRQEQSTTPRQVHYLLFNFNRIRSGAIRDRVCTLVEALADVRHEDITPTLDRLA
jgi:transcriptional regulator with XRE-family HTH domain